MESWAFEYAEKNAIEFEQGYPYVGKAETCHVKKYKEIVSVTDFAAVPKKSSAQLKSAIAVQPTCVSVDAAGLTWQLYDGGIYSDHKIVTEKQLDHAVTAVGYGSENGQDYWIVRNSWGASWGENGYIRVADKGDGAGIDGILLDASRPTTD